MTVTVSGAEAVTVTVGTSGVMVMVIGSHLSGDARVPERAKRESTAAALSMVKIGKVIVELMVCGRIAKWESQLICQSQLKCLDGSKSDR